MSAPTPPFFDPLAAFLSWLIPGLGQVHQGRVGKGILFFVSLTTLFFYGLWLGKMSNVWIPDTTHEPDASLPLLGKLDGLPKSLYYRPHFLGQFWIGSAAWPALFQYEWTPKLEKRGEEPPPAPLLGRYMQAPTETQLNDLQRSDEGHRWDLGWVYTVIAGVLNILVIWDALAGPLLIEDPKAGEKKPTETKK